MKSKYIKEFDRQAPNAEYMGEEYNGQKWVETIYEEKHDIPVTLLYVTRDGGRIAKAYCIDPDMRFHSFTVCDCHCYKDGEICTDEHYVTRTLAEKRARAILWVTGFVEFLATGAFPF